MIDFPGSLSPAASYAAEIAASAAIGGGVALVILGLAWLFARRRKDGSFIIGLQHVDKPLAIVLIVIFAASAGSAAPEAWRPRHEMAVALALPLLIGWLLIACLRAAQAIIEKRFDISSEDNLHARRKRTRTGILVRIGIIVIAAIVIAFMLLAIPGVRTIGFSLLASAGFAALAVGAAAQPALKNIIAGVQMAFTEPIKLDDAVIIEGEWGWIEEIRLTYVVVKLWDQRRLIVPVSTILEKPFQNWTYRRADIIGSIFLYLDPSADIGRLRTKFEEIVKAEPLFNGQAQVLQVTETMPEAIEVRMLASAENSPKAYDLRCAIREKMLAFIRDEMPEAFPRHRLLDFAAKPDQPVGPESLSTPPSSGTT